MKERLLIPFYFFLEQVSRICHIMDPYVVYRHVFGQPVKEYWMRDFGYIRLFVIALVCLKTDWLITNGLISIGVSAPVLGLTAAADRAFIRKQLTGLEIWINSKP